MILDKGLQLVFFSLIRIKFLLFDDCHCKIVVVSGNTIALITRVSCNYLFNTYTNIIRSRYLHVWRLQDQKLHHIVELPERVKSVKQLLALEQIFDQNNNTVSTLTLNIIF